MGDLSPIKILIVVVIALVVLGPEKLPELTRKAGKAWGDFRQFRDNMSTQVRDVIGDVPGLDELHDLPGLRSTFAGSLLVPPARTSEASGASTDAVDGTGEGSGASGGAAPDGADRADAGTADDSGGAWSHPRPPVAHRTRPRSAAWDPVLAPDDPGLN